MKYINEHAEKEEIDNNLINATDVGVVKYQLFNGNLWECGIFLKLLAYNISQLYLFTGMLIE